MTQPIAPPPRKDPLKRTRTSLLPPVPRSRAAVRMSSAAARGELRLQTCAACGTVAYPPRDACPECLSTRLDWREVSGGGQIIAETTVQTTTDAYFRERTPLARRYCKTGRRAGPDGAPARGCGSACPLSGPGDAGQVRQCSADRSAGTGDPAHGR